MIVAPFQLAIGFMFLGTLLLLAIIYGRIHWTIKSAFVISSLGFCFLTYQGYQSMLGYPVSANPPEIFKLEFAIVREPFPPANDPGSIYVWLTDPNGRQEPRAIVLPYSERNRKFVTEARQKIAYHENVYVKLHSKSPSGHNDGPGYLPDSDIMDFTQPPDTLPKKDDNTAER